MSFRHGTYTSYSSGCRCESCASYQRERVYRSRRARLASGALSHGTRSAYDAGCRCAPCRAARKAAYRRLREWPRQQQRLVRGGAA